MGKPKAWMSWSTGKDSAWALHVARQQGAVEVVALLTTLNGQFRRVAMHGVREELLDRQASALGLPLVKVPLPWPCPNETYERLMAEAISQARSEGVSCMIFADLFLRDIRRYREEKLRGTGIEPLFPVWGLETVRLAREMIAAGLEAVLTTVDPQKLPAQFAGRKFDRRLLAELPAGADPCGENGEFHTFVSAGPMFAEPVPVKVGEVVTRDGFVFADLLPANRAAPQRQNQHHR
jgi:uncharacterized protein (TIGR00290 family)